MGVKEENRWSTLKIVKKGLHVEHRASILDVKRKEKGRRCRKIIVALPGCRNFDTITGTAPEHRSLAFFGPHENTFSIKLSRRHSLTFLFLQFAFVPLDNRSLLVLSFQNIFRDSPAFRFKNNQQRQKLICRFCTQKHRNKWLKSNE